jgi:hypothetical protein
MSSLQSRLAAGSGFEMLKFQAAPSVDVESRASVAQNAQIFFSIDGGARDTEHPGGTRGGGYAKTQTVMGHNIMES